VQIQLGKIGGVCSRVRSLSVVSFLLVLTAAGASAADIPQIPVFTAPVRTEIPESRYQWRVLPTANGAEVLTLFGQFDSPGGSKTESQTVPLIAVLRDTLGDDDPRTDKLRYVWLLTYSRPSFAKRFLSAVPFFYWKLGGDGVARAGRVNKPILDMGHPTHPVWNNVGRNLLQWAALDGTPARASSRAYRTNLMDHERLHVQEAIEFLRNAPASTDGKGLSRAELDSVIGRLILRKNLLGGLMQAQHLGDVAEGRATQRSESIGRNWELLRTSAERAGLYFEPMRVGGDGENYAVVWFPIDRKFSAPGLNLDTTWKLLHISNPWHDEKLKAWNGYRQVRYLKDAGGLLPQGQSGPHPTELVPLAVYGLTYPKKPLLLMDFRSRLRTKRRELLQRTVDDLVSGVLGLSHFANWYYFAGNSLYEFVRSRRGGATGRTDRLDCYSEFRVALQLDRSLDDEFRSQMQNRLRSMSMNPLEVSASHEVDMARANYDALRNSLAQTGILDTRIEKDRRQELASFGESYPHRTLKHLAHIASFGLYTNRTPKSDENRPNLQRDRITATLMQHLRSVADGGASPEVSFAPSQIELSVSELANLAQASSSPSVRQQAAIIIARVQNLSNNMQIRGVCARALNELQSEERPKVAKANGNPGTASAAPINALSVIQAR